MSEQAILPDFEAAAEAVVNGDATTLKRLLKEKPLLVQERSAREHRSTLLHYVSANGIEDSRQNTPENILEITSILLEAGADVNAESEAYGGRATALGLTATSVHPERAGLQLALLELLIAHGSRIDSSNGESAVNACLRNGRGQAAEFLAGRGAMLNLEGAAGVGRLDLVKTFFDDRGRLRNPSLADQMKNAFAWACEFGRTEIVDFFLAHGMRVSMKLPHHQQTGLHWAALGAHTGTVKLLLSRGANVNARDEHYDSTPLDWALHGRKDAGTFVPSRESLYQETIRVLEQAGGKSSASA